MLGNVSDRGINKELRALVLVNVSQKHLPITTELRSNDRGKSVIDGVWSTPIVFDYIEHGALAPFYMEVISDHRPIVLDLNLKGFLDAKDVNMTPPAGRRLKFSSPKRVKKYIDYVEKHWKEHNIHARLTQVCDYVRENRVDTFLIPYLNNLDEQIQQILSASEK